jgi:hypothetical protein
MLSLYLDNRRLGNADCLAISLALYSDTHLGSIVRSSKSSGLLIP